MELVLEVLDASSGALAPSYSKTFRHAGGVIGRGEKCDWTLPDPKRHMSSRHAQVSYRNGQFCLTDLSSNGIRLRDSGIRLKKGQAQVIDDGQVFELGGFCVRARLVTARSTQDVLDAGSAPYESLIPDDAFLDGDPLRAFDKPSWSPDGMSHPLEFHVAAEHASVEREHLIVPELVLPGTPTVSRECVPPSPGPGFWSEFYAALGIEPDELDSSGHEAVAIRVAGLFKQCVEGVQQSLHTRDELKTELRLPGKEVMNSGLFSLSKDSSHALRVLLDSASQRASASKVVAQAYRDLQAHQVGLVAACRAAARSSLETFSPQRLIQNFEPQKPRFWPDTDGRRWRRFVHQHQRLSLDPQWNDVFLEGNFSQAYAQQIRLISALDISLPG